MNPSEYQELAARTECDQERAYGRYCSSYPLAIRLNHAVLGLAGEVGELAAAVERWLHYGQPMDSVNLTEELGDLLWYITLTCNATGTSLNEVMHSNIRKLRQRYPDKYDGEYAKEENRDRQAERAAVQAEISKRNASSKFGAGGEVNYETVLPFAAFCENRKPDEHLCCAGISIQKADAVRSPEQLAPPPALLDVHNEQVQEQERQARLVSQKRHLCQTCRGPLSDEVVRRLHSPKHRKDVYRCPNCADILITKQLICLE